MIRALIVDDEPVARRGLATLLADDPDVEVVGRCANGVDAVEAIRAERPDLVFLDVQMPDLDGFGVLEALEADELPAIVFVTAYDEYAIRAFEVNAVDYLLKPFDRERFERSLARAKRAVRREERAATEERLRRLAEYVGIRGRERVVLRDEGRVKILAPDEIAWIEAAGDYVAVHAADGLHLTRGPMAALLDRLDPRRFLRVSRSAAVNADRVRELRSLPNGQVELVLEGGETVTSSRRYGPEVREFFGEA